MMRLVSLTRQDNVVIGVFEVALGQFESTSFQPMVDYGIKGVSEVDGDVFRHHRGSAAELGVIVRLIFEFFEMSNDPDVEP
jgi:hypothetical protein